MTGIGDITLQPHVDIALPRQATFCSCVTISVGFVCFYRQNATLENRVASMARLDNHFGWIDVDPPLLIAAEDPRVFTWNDEIVILDNFCNDMHLVWMNNTRIRIPIKGKNLTPVVASLSEIVFMDIQLGRRTLCKVGVGGLQCNNPIQLHQKNVPHDCTPRGGTPAVKTADKRLWGVGHCTSKRPHDWYGQPAYPLYRMVGK